jgi:cytochrome c oxidase cbb3-type subunit 3
MKPINRLAAGGVLAATLAAALAAQGARDSQPTPQAARPTAADSSGIVAHPEHIQPGLVPPRGTELRNPYAGNARAVDEGGRLYVAYNCIDCHGAGGSGAMGPSLADGRWHFGGTDGALFESIYQGRPEGMPAWGSLIARDQIWRLVAYVQSLRPGGDVTTENFTGRTIERTGH